jgi:hypothetical protein
MILTEVIAAARSPREPVSAIYRRSGNARFAEHPRRRSGPWQALDQSRKKLYEGGERLLQYGSVT